MPLIGPEGREQLKVAARVGAVGFELAAAVTLGALGGRYLDTRFGTGPYFLLGGVVLGAIVGFFAIYRVARRINLDKL